jgi:hypothetical protein
MRSLKDIKKSVAQAGIDTASDIDRAIRGRLLERLNEEETTAGQHRPTRRRIIMRSPLMKLTAAAAVLVLGIGFVSIWRGDGQTAYAFEQTVEAMQGKKSFHIQTYFNFHSKDEFWAEFDENGKVVRYRQEELEGPQGPVVTLWEGGIRTKYYPKPAGIARISNMGNTEGELEEFDPETTVQEIYDRVAAGEATLEIREASPSVGLMTIQVTYTERSLEQTLIVDPETKFVVRVDNRYCDADEEAGYGKSIEVLEYNEPIPMELFQPDFPEDTIILDQVSQVVGLAQGDMTNEEIALVIVSEALEAWAACDYAKAGQLFGGAPPELLTERYADLHPVRILSIGQPVLTQYSKPWFMVPCRYEVAAGDQLKTIDVTLHALAVDGQPGQWYVRIDGRSP